MLYLECELEQVTLWLMYFQVKMLEHGRKNIFRDKRTRNKVPSMFFDVIVLNRTRTIVLMDSVKKQAKVQCMYLALENFKIRSKKGQQWL